MAMKFMILCLAIFSFSINQSKCDEINDNENVMGGDDETPYEDKVMKKIEILTNESMVEVNQSLTLTCLLDYDSKKVTEDKINIYWSKASWTRNKTLTREPLGGTSMGIIYTSLADRYTLFRSELNQDLPSDDEKPILKITDVLMIKNATKYDSGMFSCIGIIGQVLNPSEKTEHANVSVIVNSVVGTTWNVTNYNTTVNRSGRFIEMYVNGTEGDTKELICTIRHTNKCRKYNGGDVLLSGSKDGKLTNYSRFFTRQIHNVTTIDPNLLEEKLSTANDKEIPPTQSFELTYTNKTYKFTHMDNGQYLHCRSSSKNNVSDSVIYMNITHKPYFHCDHRVKIREGKRYGKVECKVMANPLLLDKITWKFKIGAGKDVELKVGETKTQDGNTFKAIVKKLDAGMAHIQLQIGQVRRDNFVEYEIKAENRLGRNEVKIDLERDSNKAVKTSSVVWGIFIPLLFSLGYH